MIETDNLLNLYMNDIAKFSLLTPEEEKRLGMRAKQGDQKAIDALVNANLRLVVRVAQNYTENTSLSMLDLIQEGNTGLIKAAQSFDCGLGTKFSTHAVWWIKQAISKAIVDQSRTIRLPANLVNDTNKVKKAMRIIQQRKSGADATVEELAAETEFPEEKILTILEGMKDIKSLDVPVKEEEDTTIGELIAEQTFGSPESQIINQDTIEVLLFILDTLSNREKSVIEKRFGLNGGTPKTLEEVGEDLGITRERVRQIEIQALRKLRHPARSNAIRECLS